MIFQLLYVSTATHKMDEQELIEILRKARIINGQKEISGFLLYMDGAFAQVLEGSEKEVKDLYYDIIAKDNRHHDCMVLMDRTVNSGEFPEWTMGFHNLSGNKLDQIPGFTDVRNWAKAQDRLFLQTGELRKLMLGLVKAFKED